MERHLITWDDGMVLCPVHKTKLDDERGCDYCDAEAAEYVEMAQGDPEEAEYFLFNGRPVNYFVDKDDYVSDLVDEPNRYDLTLNDLQFLAEIEQGFKAEVPVPQPLPSSTVKASKAPWETWAGLNRSRR
jgi:hypothetical protein